MALKTTDNDKEEKRIRKEMNKLKRSFVTVGVHKDAGKYSGGNKNPTVAQVAAWNEFGTGTAPARPFIRSTVDTEKNKLFRANLREFRRITDGRSTAKKSLDRLGFLLQTLIQKRIQTSSSWAKPNAPSVAARKRRGGAARGPTPLIETLLLHNSVSFKSKVRGR